MVTWQQEKKETEEETGSVFQNNLLPPEPVRYSNKVLVLFDGLTKRTTSKQFHGETKPQIEF